MSKKPPLEEENLFAGMMSAQEESSPLKKMKTAKRNFLPEPDKTPAPSPEKSAAASSWKEKIWEFDLTRPSQFMRDTMKESMLQEGFGKREANKIFKGLFFKEKVCNTKAQALEYLKTVPTSYAVKYKVGIPPSPKMITLEKRLTEKAERLVSCQKEQEKKFSTAFLTCPHCKSKVNSEFIHPPLCPVCGEDMRSGTAIETLTALEETRYFQKGLQILYRDSHSPGGNGKRPDQEI